MMKNRYLRSSILFSVVVFGFTLILMSVTEPESRGDSNLTGIQEEASSAKPRVITFVAEPPMIGEGGSTTLIWVTEDALSVSISGVGQVALSGRQAVRPLVSTTYKLTAVNAAGETMKAVDVHVMPMLGRPVH